MNPLQRIDELQARKVKVLEDLTHVPIIENDNPADDNLFELMAETGQYREELQAELHEINREISILNSSLASLTEEEFNEINENYAYILKNNQHG